MVTKVYAPLVWGARGNGQAHVCTHLNTIECYSLINLSHHPNNCSKMSKIDKLRSTLGRLASPRTQSESSLSGFAEAQPFFETKSQRRTSDKAQLTIADPKTKFFNFANEPLEY